MVNNALRGYLQLANGLTEVTKQRATEAARALSAQFGIQGEDAIAGASAAAGIATQQVQALAEDLFAQARSNRRLLTELVRLEVERGVARLGLAEQHQIEALLAAVSRLEDQVSGLLATVRRSAPTPPKRDASKASAGGARPLKKAAAKKTPAKKAAATTAPAKKVPAKKVAVKKAPAKKVAVKKVSAKKVSAKKVSAKKVTAKKAPATAAPVKAVPARKLTSVTPVPAGGTPS